MYSVGDDSFDFNEKPYLHITLIFKGKESFKKYHHGS